LKVIVLPSSKSNLLLVTIRSFCPTGRQMTGDIPPSMLMPTPVT